MTLLVNDTACTTPLKNGGRNRTQAGAWHVMLYLK